MNRAIDLVRSDASGVLQGRAEQFRPLQGRHLFVSGGTGFLGAWLLELISILNQQYGLEIRATVFSRSARRFAEKWPHLGQLHWVRFQDGDIRYLDELPQDTAFIIHAAALTDRRLFASQPSAVAETNAMGTLRILRAARLLDDVRRIVLLSSGLVYGSQPWDMPAIDENYAGPLRCDTVSAVYAESKRFAEVIGQCAISESKLPVVTLRPFAFVGPYQSLQLPWAVTDFIRDSFNGGPIRIMGDGSTVRSLMYGADYALWVLTALARGGGREIYNVGSPEPVDLLTLAEIITRQFSPGPEIQTNLGRGGHDRSRLVPCVKHTAASLDVAVMTPLTKAIQRTVEWHRFIQGK